MPRPDRRVTTAATAVTLRIATCLMSGHDWGFLEPQGGPYGSKVPRAVLAAAWASVGDALIALHVRHWPGTRPWGFWAMERGMEVRVDWDEDAYPTQWHYLQAYHLLRPEDPQHGPPPRLEDVEEMIAQSAAFHRMHGDYEWKGIAKLHALLRAHPPVEWPHVPLSEIGQWMGIEEYA